MTKLSNFLRAKYFRTFWHVMALVRALWDGLTLAGVTALDDVLVSILK